MFCFVLFIYIFIAAFSNETIAKSNNRAFSYRDILKITDNLKIMIGGGGFGRVYLGTLENDAKVAVKLLSQSSVQGYKEFQSEVRCKNQMLRKVQLLQLKYKNYLSIFNKV